MRSYCRSTNGCLASYGQKRRLTIIPPTAFYDNDGEAENHISGHVKRAAVPNRKAFTVNGTRKCQRIQQSSRLIFSTRLACSPFDEGPSEIWPLICLGKLSRKPRQLLSLLFSVVLPTCLTPLSCKLCYAQTNLSWLHLKCRIWVHELLHLVVSLSQFTSDRQWSDFASSE